jgi:hypothetical protein
MPIYRSKPIELRFATEENRVDIAKWINPDEDVEVSDIALGYYYDKGFTIYSQHEVETYFDEIE